MKIHHLKTWPEYFLAVKHGVKPFEIRKNDRDFKCGDILILKEWDRKKEEYTGSEITAYVKYALHNNMQSYGPANEDGGPLSGLEYGYVIMAIDVVKIDEPAPHG